MSYDAYLSGQKVWTPVMSTQGYDWVSVAGNQSLQILVGVTEDRLFISQDYGITWDQVTTLPANDGYTAVCIQPNGTHIFVATVNAGAPTISYTTDLGVSWTTYISSGDIPSGFATKVLAMARVYGNDILYFVTTKGFLKKFQTDNVVNLNASAWNPQSGDDYTTASIALAYAYSANQGIFSIGNDSHPDDGIMANFDADSPINNINILPPQYKSVGGPVGIAYNGATLFFMVRNTTTDNDDLYWSRDGGGGGDFTLISENVSGFAGGWSGKLIYYEDDPDILYTALIDGQGTSQRLILTPQTLFSANYGIVRSLMATEDGFDSIIIIPSLANKVGLFVSLTATENPVFFDQTIISSLTVSSINGAQPGGGGGGGPQINTSSITASTILLGNDQNQIAGNGPDSTITIQAQVINLTGLLGGGPTSITMNELTSTIGLVAELGMSFNTTYADGYIQMITPCTIIVSPEVIISHQADNQMAFLSPSSLTISTITVSSINGAQPGGGGSIPANPYFNSISTQVFHIEDYIAPGNYPYRIRANSGSALIENSSGYPGDLTISTLTVSSINGQEPGGGGGGNGPDIVASTVTTIGLEATSISTTFFYADSFSANIDGTSIQAFSIPWSKMQQIGDYTLYSGTWNLDADVSISTLTVNNNFVASTIQTDSMLVRNTVLFCTITAPAISSIFISSKRAWIDTIYFRIAEGDTLTICTLNVNNFTVADFSASSIRANTLSTGVITTFKLRADEMELLDVGVGDYVSTIVSTRQLYISGINVIAPTALSSQLLSTSEGLQSNIDATSTSIGIEIGFLAGQFISSLPPTLSSSTLLTSSVQFFDAHTDSNVLMNVSAGILLLNGQPIQGGGGTGTSTFVSLYTSSFVVSSIQNLSTGGGASSNIGMFFAGTQTAESGVSLKTSVDGITWTDVPGIAPNGVTALIAGVSSVMVFTNSIGIGPTIHYTSNGSNYTTISNIGNYNTTLGTYGGGWWVAQAEDFDFEGDALFATSTLGTAWRQAVFPALIGGAQKTFKSMAYDPNTQTWVVGGDMDGGASNLFWITGNPVAGLPWNDQLGGGVGPVVGLTFGKGSAASQSTFVGITTGGQTIFSGDGKTWSNCTGTNSNSGGKGLSVSYANGLFFATKENSNSIWVSSNANDWTYASNGLDSNCYQVAYADGLYVAGGKNSTGPPYATSVVSSNGLSFTTTQVNGFTQEPLYYLVATTLSYAEPAVQIPITLSYTSTQQATISTLNILNQINLTDLAYPPSTFPLNVSDATLLFNGSTIQGGGGGATVSSFQQLFTSSFQASTITMGGTLYTSTILSPQTGGGGGGAGTYYFAGTADSAEYGTSILYSTDGQNWLPTTSGATAGVNYITVAASTVLVVLSNYTLIKSTDGLTFTPVSFPGSNPIYQPYYADGFWVIPEDDITVPGQGTIWISDSNLTSWAQASNLPDSNTYPLNWKSFAFNGSTWVGVAFSTAPGSNIPTAWYASNPNGPWTPATNIPGETDLENVLFGSSNFVAIAITGTNYWSADGITWTQGSLSLLSAHQGFVYSPTINRFVVSANEYLEYSDDEGQTWTPTTTNPFSNSIMSMSYANDLFIAGGQSGGKNPPFNTLAYSSDGNTWTLATSGQFTQLMVFATGAGTLAGGTPSQPGPVFISYTSTQHATISTLSILNQINLTDTTHPPSTFALTVSSATLLFNGSTIQGGGGGATVSSFQQLFTSSFQASTITMGGTLYTSTIISPNIESFPPITTNYYYVGADNVEFGTTLLYSTDGGYTYLPTDSGITATVTGIHVGSNTVLIGFNDGSLKKSIDGITFTSITPPGVNSYTKPFYADGYWLLGEQFTGKIWVSSNLSSWTEATVTSSTGTVFSFAFDGIDKWVAVGTGDLPSPILYCVGAPTGTWTAVAGLPGVAILDVTFGNSSFVAAANTGAIYRSLDGVSWPTPYPSGLDSILSITYSPDSFRFVVGGSNSSSNTISYSDDGQDWTLADPMPLDRFVTSVSYANHIFIASGQSGSGVAPWNTIAISSDGQFWYLPISGYFETVTPTQTAAGSITVTPSPAPGPVFLTYISSQKTTASTLTTGVINIEDYQAPGQYPFRVRANSGSMRVETQNGELGDFSADTAFFSTVLSEIFSSRDAMLIDSQGQPTTMIASSVNIPGESIISSLTVSSINGQQLSGEATSSFSTVYVSSFLNFTDQSNSANAASLSNYNSTLYFNTFALVNITELTSTYNALLGQISSLSTSLATLHLNIQNTP